MSFSRPIQWYHANADPIWPDDTFKGESKMTVNSKEENSLDFCLDFVQEFGLSTLSFKKK